MAALFDLEVHTPYRLFFSGPAAAFTAPLADGDIGVLAGRSPFTAPLEIGVLRIRAADGAWREASVTAGIVEVTRKGAVILASAAEWADEIDRDRAEAARARAEERLSGGMLKFEAVRAQAALARALNRLAAAGRTSPFDGAVPAGSPESG